SRYFLAPNSSPPVTSTLKTSIGSISALQQPRYQQSCTYSSDILGIRRNGHLHLQQLFHRFGQALDERGSAHHDNRFLDLYLLQLLLIYLLGNGVAGGHGHVLGLVAHGKAIDQALCTKNYAVAVHGHISVVSLQS